MKHEDRHLGRSTSPCLRVHLEHYFPSKGLPQVAFARFTKTGGCREPIKPTSKSLIKIFRCIYTTRYTHTTQRTRQRPQKKNGSSIETIYKITITHPNYHAGAKRIYIPFSGERSGKAIEVLLFLNRLDLICNCYIREKKIRPKDKVN